MSESFREKILDILLPAFCDREKASSRFAALSEIVRKTNEVMNITAVTEEDEITLRHFADSLLLFSTGVFTGEQQRAADIGSGGGFPGLPLKIADEKLDITLIDSTEKKVSYLSDTANALDLDGISCVAARAEELTGLKFPASSQNRERFDIVTARGVARLNILSELCLPFVRTGGYFLSMKGQRAAEELQEAQKGIALLGGSIESVEDYTPDAGLFSGISSPVEKALVDEFLSSSHIIIKIKKVAKTPSSYPRAFAAIKKRPL